jgi:hypothetical protein
MFVYTSQMAHPKDLFGADDELGAGNYLQGLDPTRLAKYFGKNSKSISLARTVMYDDPFFSRSDPCCSRSLPSVSLMPGCCPAARMCRASRVSFN